MKTLHEIKILDSVKNLYITKITLYMYISNSSFCLITETNYKGEINRFVEYIDTYKDALSKYIKEVNEYATHTVLMNL